MEKGGDCSTAFLSSNTDRSQLEARSLVLCLSWTADREGFREG